MFSDGKMDHTTLEKLLEEIEEEHNRRNKPLTATQINREREDRARTKAFDKLHMMSKQEWNPN